jgi:pre-mRNA-splicing factor CDC5/CEF1
MRIQFRGGLWTNAEDEILKAALMKYGFNNWRAVASMLPKKTSKQCRRRWTQWLDPSLKKGEWSLQDDEKLLRLAKKLPTQWRTIAPMLSRTALQCLERYELLLDVAAKSQKTEKDDDEKDDNDIDAIQKQRKRLREGEIDVNADSRPARADRIDMDDDTRLMLAEVQARLANTHGKKSQRREREKQMEQARRLATLRKQRELRAAGIAGSERNRGANDAMERIKIVAKRRKRAHRIGYVDANLEVPFQRHAPSSTSGGGVALLDTADEDRRMRQQRAERRFQPVSLNKLRERQQRVRRGIHADDHHTELDANDKETAKSASASPSASSSAPSATKLDLPAPQLSERELALAAKLDAREQRALRMAAAERGSGATRHLLPERKQASSSRTPLGDDVIGRRARQLASLRAQQTPLLMLDDDDNVDDRTVVADNEHAVPQTPNLLAANVSLKAADARQSRKRARAAASSLAQAFKRMPAAQYEYDVVQPPKRARAKAQEQRDDDGGGAGGEEDQAILLAEERQRAEQHRRQQAPSASLRDDLPALVRHPRSSSPSLSPVDRMIDQEMSALTSGQAEPVDYALLCEAQRLIDADLSSSSSSSSSSASSPALEAGQAIYVPSLGRWAPLNALSESQVRESRADASRRLAEQVDELQEIGAEHEQSCALRFADADRQIEELRSRIEATQLSLLDARLQLTCFSSLADSERRGIEHRKADVSSYLSALQALDSD